MPGMGKLTTVLQGTAQIVCVQVLDLITSKVGLDDVKLFFDGRIKEEELDDLPAYILPTGFALFAPWGWCTLIVGAVMEDEAADVPLAYMERYMNDARPARRWTRGFAERCTLG